MATQKLRSLNVRKTDTQYPTMTTFRYGAVLQFIFLIVLAEGDTLMNQDENPCHQNDFRFSNLFQDGMVLQREPEKATLWGYGTLPDGAAATVTCSTPQKTKHSFDGVLRQDAEEMWKLVLEPQVGGAVCTIEINLGCGGQISIKEVIFGDIYLCSGQSNMEFRMGSIYNATEEIDYSRSYTDIRFTKVNHGTAEKSDDTWDIDLAHPWSDSKSNNLNAFSAVCYLYARNIYDKLGIPLGLIESNWGGTHIESWMSPGMLDACGIDQEQPNCNGDMQNCNSRLYNKMIYPLRKTTLKGFLWYQGEANAGWQRDLYNCSFPMMIDGWRSIFSSTAEKYPPFGFVQLSTVTYGKQDLSYPLIRWHQTADYGSTPNDREQNVFYAVSIDTFDEPNGVHPHYKQIVGERLAIAGMHVVYEDESYPACGPRVKSSELLEGPILSLEYTQDIIYNNDEISGFYYCCMEDYYECDRGNNKNWMELEKELVEKRNHKTMDIKVGELIVCDMEVPHLAYLWRQTPIKNYLGAPIYANDAFGLPSPPWKMSAGQVGDAPMISC